jgi:hypothetical protein
MTAVVPEQRVKGRNHDIHDANRDGNRWTPRGARPISRAAVHDLIAEHGDPSKGQEQKFSRIAGRKLLQGGLGVALELFM